MIIGEGAVDARHYWGAVLLPDRWWRSARGPSAIATSQASRWL